MKAAPGAGLADRVRMQNLGLSLVMLGQGVPFFHAGDDLLRSKSLDGNSYNSGDWFNRLDFTYQSNNFAVGLPMAGDNQSNWPLMQPLLANPALKPSQAEILASLENYKEMLAIRRSSSLFRLQTGQQVIDRLKFYNTGPAQIPGLIVMHLDGEGFTGKENPYQSILVLFNATHAQVSFANPDFASMAYHLHPIQAGSRDQIVRQASFDQAGGAFSVPARTAAVFVVDAPPEVGPSATSVTPRATPSAAVFIPAVAGEAAKAQPPSGLNQPWLPWLFLGIVAILAIALIIWRRRINR